MIKKLLTAAVLLSMVLIPTPANSTIQIRKPITCITQDAFAEFIKQFNLQMIVASTDKNVDKIIFINPRTSDLLLIHLVHSENVACLIDDMVNVQSTIELLPKIKKEEKTNLQ